MPQFTSVAEAISFFSQYLRNSMLSQAQHPFGDPHLYLDRACYLYRLLGNPEQHQKVIHIAGTSGKGSTAQMISLLLQEHGFTVGTFLSPHLFDYRERFQLNNQWIDEQTLLNHLNKVVPLIEKMGKTSIGRPSFFEINNAIAYQFFNENRVDYVVLETGVGGLYDSTNTNTTADRLSVITDIGYDHQNLLGKTLTSIAYQKAGIIKPRGKVIALWGSEESNQVVEDIAFAKGAQLDWVRPIDQFVTTAVTEAGSLFDYHTNTGTLKDLELGVLGEHQVRNASTALTALYEVAKRDQWTVKEAVVRKTLKHTSHYIHAKVERISLQTKAGKKVAFLDMAHNPQKIAALSDCLQTILPTQKFDFLFAAKANKEFTEMIDSISSIANSIIVTRPTYNEHSIDLPFKNALPSLICQYVREHHPHIKTKAISNPHHAYEALIDTAQKPIVITGSSYLIMTLKDVLQRDNLQKLADPATA
jgi:dihydrofolate synthase/folylpolyglutamate synthase